MAMLDEFAERWPNSSLFILVLIFILSHKSQLDVSQKGGWGVSGKRQNNVINDKIVFHK